ncbi:uncharacterized protein CXorf65 homolog isoform X2 [Pelobates fuscus]|uniref:uncharacterized protein CXorf65 homolog isoform X2 n=1 Tax=Pelobates fuscus TaxID=191477 RepID=UPI002FE47D25
MFIRVLYGDNKEALFNINCKVQLLLAGIKSYCRYENEGDVELADENGQVKSLLENQHVYATEILNERETCILLSVTRPHGSTEVVFTPLLNDETIVNAKFLAKLGNCEDSKTSSRKSKAKKPKQKSTVVISTPPEGKQTSPTRTRSVKQ